MNSFVLAPDTKRRLEFRAAELKLLDGTMSDDMIESCNFISENDKPYFKQMSQLIRQLRADCDEAKEVSIQKLLLDIQKLEVKKNIKIKLEVSMI